MRSTIIDDNHQAAGLTSPPRVRGPMKPRLEHALQALGENRSVEDILAVLADYPVCKEQPCLRMGCSRVCEWQASGGRPKLFCSESCRRRQLRERETLQSELAELESCLTQADTVRRRQTIETQMANVRWQLARYPVATLG